MDYEILAVDECRYGLIQLTPDGRMHGIVEKPDFLLCSDGCFRVRDRSGQIIERLTTRVGSSAPVGLLDIGRTK